MSAAPMPRDAGNDDISALDSLAATPVSPLEEAARVLTEAMHLETSIARVGALPEFAAAADRKLRAFDRFNRLRQPAATQLISATEREAIRELIAAADESAIVLDAVRSTLNDVARRLSQALGSVADPGTYGRTGRRLRHTLAASVDSTV